MKDDDSSDIVRSSTAHQVNVSEYTGNATTPQNRVTSGVDEALPVAESDPNENRLHTGQDTHVVDTATHAADETVADTASAHDDHVLHVDTDAADPTHRVLMDDSAAVTDAHVGAPVTQFTDDLATLERALHSPTHHEGVGHSGVSDTHATRPSEHLQDTRQGLPSEHTATTRSVVHEEAQDPQARIPLDHEAHAAHAADATEAKAPLHDEDATAPKEALSDHRARLPETSTLPHAGLPSVSDAPAPEADPTDTPAHPHAGPAHAAAHPRAGAQARPPAHAARHSPTEAALSEMASEEFQGRLAGIKREVQELNERLTDLETDLGKTPTRPAGKT